MKLAISIIFFGGCWSLCAQGTFQNLDFESANLTPIPAGQFGGPVSISAALSGWSAALGTTTATTVLQNNYDTGSVNISILGPDWNGNPGIIQGNYTVGLQGGIGPGASDLSASLWQNGSIPANAKSLEFDAASFGGPPISPTVTFAGNTLSTLVISSDISPSGQTYDVYGANIAPYAGQTGQLQFTAPFGDSIELDDILFSPNVVPEPSPFVVSGIAGLLFAAYRRFAPKG
jgi:hypothetical protein